MLSDENDRAVLVDVRTRAEWSFVGTPQPAEDMNDLIRLEWQTYPSMEVTHDFVERLAADLSSKGLGKDTRLCFLCKAGGRSLAAAKAMFANGYENSFNICNGFDGDRDPEGHRGTLNGWKKEGLPWRQA